PAQVVFPYLRLFNDAGTKILFRPQQSGHNMSWYPNETQEIQTFIEKTMRTPLPDKLSWETDLSERGNRDHWLVISGLGARKGESTFEEVNNVTPIMPGLSLGVDVEPANGGVRITGVDKGTIADLAGLQIGDVVVDLNSAPTPTVDDLVQALQGVHYGGK